eukprot:4354834-Prymnesium_polylepis.2
MRHPPTRSLARKGQRDLHLVRMLNEPFMHTPLCSPTDQGTCAGLSRWGTAPSCVSGSGTHPLHNIRMRMSMLRVRMYVCRPLAHMACVSLVSHRLARGYVSACPDGAPSFPRTGSIR